MIVKTLSLLPVVVLAVVGQCPAPCRCPSSNLAYCTSAGLTHVPRYRFNAELIKLDFSNNSLTELDKISLVDLQVPSLEELDLSSNLIETFHRNAVDHLTKLELLDLSSNLLRDIDVESFVYNHHLHSLFLSRNYFFRPPLLLSSSLEVLHLSCCNLQEIPDSSFSGLPLLRELNLSHNRIEVLDSLLGTHQVKILDISYNHLMSLTPELLDSLPSLSELDVSNNWMYTLTSDVVTMLVNVIDSRALQGNPWVCDCFLYNTTYSWCKENFNSLNILCSSPPSMKGKPWTAYEEIVCADSVDFVDDVIKMLDDVEVVDEMEVIAGSSVYMRKGALKSVTETRTKETGFKVDYTRTSVLFGLCVFLMAVALFTWFRLTAIISIRTGPSKDGAENNNLTSDDV